MATTKKATTVAEHLHITTHPDGSALVQLGDDRANSIPLDRDSVRKLIEALGGIKGPIYPGIVPADFIVIDPAILPTVLRLGGALVTDDSIRYYPASAQQQRDVALRALAMARHLEQEEEDAAAASARDIKVANLAERLYTTMADKRVWFDGFEVHVAYDTPWHDASPSTRERWLSVAREALAARDE